VWIDIAVFQHATIGSMNSSKPHARRQPVRKNTAPQSPLNEHELHELEAGLDRIPAPFEPMDIVALDGYLCGIIVQPQPIPYAQWWPHIADEDGRPLNVKIDLTRVQALVRRRHAELEQAIREREWFDPWIFEFDDQQDDSVLAVLPWVAGFATAMNLFTDLMAMDEDKLLGPLALIYQYLSADDLEDADNLLLEIASLEPGQDLNEAVQNLVQATLLLADVSRPLPDDDTLA
jgi:uncharacterized protein